MVELKLPAGVVASFTTTSIDEHELFPPERLICQSYEPDRKQDFVRGRYCAHECLRRLSFPQPVAKSELGAPLWPEGLTGSISHSRHLAGAILAKKGRFRSLGLDIEVVGRITPDLWPVIFTKAEMDFLIRQRLPDRWSTFIFSAKEAFYKMQYPMTKAGMEAEDLEVVVGDAGVIFRAKDSFLSQLSKDCVIHYTLSDRHVISSVLLENR